MIHFFGSLAWWEILLMLIGVIAIFDVLLELFSTFGDHTKKRSVTENHPVDSEEFIQAIARLSNSPIEQGEDVKILNNGDEFLAALLGAIGNARQTINFTTYIWEEGVMSKAIFVALLERAKAGVEVRLLLDGFGGFFASYKRMGRLKLAGGRVKHFRLARFGKLSRLHRRNHRRAIVIDGKIGFTGGMAVADHWLGNARNEKEWRDMMFEVRGHMAKSLQAAFAQLWATTNGEILEGSKFYPTFSPAEQTGPLCKYVSIASSPASDTQPLTKFFWLSIASARKKIYLNSSYVVPDDHIRHALMDRARAGVDVRLLLPNNKTDAKPIRLASHYYFEKYLKAGVKIYEYQPTMIHSKIIIIDDIWSVIGSSNMGIRSVELNEENVLGINNPRFAQELGAVFLKDQQKAQQITLKQWEKRGPLERLGEMLFVRFIKQY